MGKKKKNDANAMKQKKRKKKVSTRKGPGNHCSIEQQIRGKKLRKNKSSCKTGDHNKKGGDSSDRGQQKGGFKVPGVKK